jgi:DNA-binding transcriptional LysR family regulator
MQLDNSYAILQMVKAGLGWTLTTPLCLLHGGIKTGDVQCLPVPEGEFCRELTLLARSDELGHLPELLADDSIALMRERYLPVIATAAPWLLPRIVLG